MRSARGHGRWVLVLGAAVLLAACAPPPTEAWQQGDELVRGHVILPSTNVAWPTVMAPADTGGVVVGSIGRATRLGDGGEVRYDLGLGSMAVSAAASARGRDLYAGSVDDGSYQRSARLLAFTASGFADPFFGHGGTVTLQRPAEPANLPIGFTPKVVPEAVSVDALGRVYVALTADVGGNAFPDLYALDAWVLRLLPNGCPDVSYGVDGAAYLGRLPMQGYSERLMRHGLIDVSRDGSVTVALPGDATTFGGGVSVSWLQPGGTGVRRMAVNAGSSPIGSGGWRVLLQPTGLHRAGGRTLVAVAPGYRLTDPGIVAIDESAMALDDSFGDRGVLAWRVEGSSTAPPMTTPVVSVGGIRAQGDGTFTVPVLTQQGQPGIASFDGQGRLLHPQLPGGVTVVRTAQQPNLVFATGSSSGGGWGWFPEPQGVEMRDGALASAYSGGWHLAGVNYVEPAGADDLAVLRIRSTVG
jgi:hypothetical protein